MDGFLLERESELALIDEALAGARAARGRVVLVVGSAGVGKTSLLAAAADRARASRFEVLNARAVELERSFAFGVCLQLFARFCVAVMRP